MEKVNVTVRLEAEVVAFLDELGTALDRDRSYLIKRAVAEYVSLHRWQVEEVQRALAEAAAGTFAKEDQVQEVFGRLGA